MTRKKGMVFTSGRAVIITKESFLMTLDMGMERCSEWTRVFIKVSGLEGVRMV